MTEPFHSALAPEAPAIIGPTSKRWINGSMAFVLDASEPLPSQYFTECDVWYVEPPWPRGLAKFDARAGKVTPGGFTALMKKIAGDIESAKFPVIMMLSKQAQRIVPKPIARREMNLVGAAAFHGHPVQACFWNLEPPADLPLPDTTALIAWLATRYQCVGDFCSGYGNAAVMFHRAGKRFIASDYNAQCITRLISRVDE